jgi:hypothetical protein
MNSLVWKEADAQKDERPHPPTISKRPGKLRYLRTSGSCASPAASDMSPAHRPAPARTHISHPSLLSRLTLSLWYVLAVVCGGLVLTLRWQGLFSGLRWKRIDPRSPVCCIFKYLQKLLKDKKIAC